MKTNIIDEIGYVIGVTATMRFLALFGGTKLYIPEVMHKDHPIALGIGLDAATKLSETFSREHIDVPEGDDFNRLQRVRRIAGLLRIGTSPRDVAMLVGISTRHVSNCRVEAEALGLIPSVFD